MFDRALLTTRRNRVAPLAHDHDFLLARVADDIAERLAAVTRSFDLAANVGAHHGLVSRRLRGLANVGLMFDADPAPSMLARCDGPSLRADEEWLPFADGALDLVVSGLALHMVNDLTGALLQIQRALRPDGLLLAALLGGETLRELRTAFLAAEAEEGGAGPRVAPFATVRQLGELLSRAGFALPVIDSDTVQVAYASPLALMREIKAMGASNMLSARPRRPTTRGLLARAAEIYAKRYSRSDGRVIATFEIVTLTAWSPHESQPKPLQPGSAQRSLAEVLPPPAKD